MENAIFLKKKLIIALLSSFSLVVAPAMNIWRLSTQLLKRFLMITTMCCLIVIRKSRNMSKSFPKLSVCIHRALFLVLKNNYGNHELLVFSMLYIRWINFRGIGVQIELYYVFSNKMLIYIYIGDYTKVQDDWNILMLVGYCLYQLMKHKTLPTTRTRPNKHFFSLFP